MSGRYRTQLNVREGFARPKGNTFAVKLKRPLPAVTAVRRAS